MRAPFRSGISWLYVFWMPFLLIPIAQGFEESGLILSSASDGIYLHTHPVDVAALRSMESIMSFNFSASWTGDPCLLAPFEGLTCSRTQGKVRVTKINLSRYDVFGTISPKIAELTALTELRLDNNMLFGALPDLQNLTRLRILHLHNNFLTGPVPKWLATLPALKELFLSNNYLSGPIPNSLERRQQEGLKLRVSGNSDLCRARETCATFTYLNDEHLTQQRDQLDILYRNRTEGSDSKVGTRSRMATILVVLIVGLADMFRNSSGLLVIVVVQVLYKVTKRRSASLALYEEAVTNAGKEELRRFLPMELDVITSSRRRKIRGHESTSKPVYHAMLPDGTEVEVKVFTPEPHHTRNYFKEISLLTKLQHRNIVSLLGYCRNGDEKNLIYEYMANGTLREHLPGTGSKWTLSWRQRLHVALHAAKGLEYLHNEISPSVIHGNLTSEYILLAKNLEPKLAGFDRAENSPQEQSDGDAYLWSQEGDVYNFGVVLLEIISGATPTATEPGSSDVSTFVEWARQKLDGGELKGMVDPQIYHTCNDEALSRVVQLAMRCVDSRDVDASLVVDELTAALETEYGMEIFELDEHRCGSLAEGPAGPSAADEVEEEFCKTGCSILAEHAVATSFELCFFV